MTWSRALVGDLGCIKDERNGVGGYEEAGLG